MSTTPTTWLGKLFAKIGAWISGASSAFHDTTVIADNLVNMLKTATSSTIGQILETGIEMAIPASTGLVNAFNGWLQVTVVTLNWAVAEEGKSQQQIILDAINYLNTLKTTNPDAYASQLNTLNALIQKWFSDNQGLGTTIQAALVAAQAVHDPTLVSVTGAVQTFVDTVAPASEVAKVVDQVAPVIEEVAPAYTPGGPAPLTPEPEGSPNVSASGGSQ